MNAFELFVLRVRYIFRRHTLQERWRARYRAAKIALGLPKIDDTREYDRIYTLDKGSREAFMRAIAIEVTNFNREQFKESPRLIRWRHVSDVFDRLGVWGVQKGIYDMMRSSSSKPVSTFDIKNFESHNPEDTLII